MKLDLKDFLSNILDEDNFNSGLAQIIIINILFYILLELEGEILKDLEIKYFILSHDDRFEGIVFKSNSEIMDSRVGIFNINIFKMPYTRDVRYSYSKKKNGNFELIILDIKKVVN